MPYSALEFRVRILTEEAITELIVLVSEEIDARAGGLGGQRKAIEGELAYVRRRPARLYEALETTELTMQALSPRILALRQREDQLPAAREDADRQLRQRKPDLSTSAEIAEYGADFRRFLESGTFSGARGADSQIRQVNRGCRRQRYVDIHKFNAIRRIG